MNTPRLVAGIVVRGGLHVQSVGFQKYRPVGSPVESAREFDRWGIDEIALVLLDHDPLANQRLVADVSAAIAVPLAAIGGIRTLAEAKAYIAGGADKLGFNSGLVKNPEVVRHAADLFGEQCIVGSIDLVRMGGRPARWDYWRTCASNIDAVAWLRTVETMGAGEILLNFPERDGLCRGMDIEMIRDIVDATSLPVVAMGGIGTAAHAGECFREARPSGIGVGNRLSHFEHSILLFKKGLADSGAMVRSAVRTNYADAPTDVAGRPARKTEQFLSDLLFQRIEPETI